MSYAISWDTANECDPTFVFAHHNEQTGVITILDIWGGDKIIEGKFEVVKEPKLGENKAD